MMTIYISGKITGLPFDQVCERFDDAQMLLQDLGFEVANPLNNGVAVTAPWIDHFCTDIKILDGCDAIYMMDNWRDSRGGRHEYQYALDEGKDILFESTIIPNEKIVWRIQNAIHEVTGLKFNDYITKSRKRDGFFARMLFVYHCRQNEMKLKSIAKYVHRDHSSMLHLLKKYDDEVKYNPYFRNMARRVSDILNDGKA